MLERIVKFCIVLLFIALASFAVWLILTGGDKAPAKPAPTPVKPAPTPAPTPIVAKDYADAIAKALASKRKIFIYVGATWCAPCVQMQATTMADPKVQAALAQYVTLTLEFDKNKKLAHSLKATDLPSYLIADADRTVVSRGTGYKNAADFLAWLGNAKSELSSNP